MFVPRPYSSILIIGKSKCGKTTLMNNIVASLQPLRERLSISKQWDIDAVNELIVEQQDASIADPKYTDAIITADNCVINWKSLSVMQVLASGFRHNISFVVTAPSCPIATPAVNYVIMMETRAGNRAELARLYASFGYRFYDQKEQFVEALGAATDCDQHGFLVLDLVEKRAYASTASGLAATTSPTDRQHTAGWTTWVKSIFV